MSEPHIHSHLPFNPVAFEFRVGIREDGIRVMEVTLADTKNFILLGIDESAEDTELEMVNTMINHATDLFTSGIVIANKHNQEDE